MAQVTDWHAQPLEVLGLPTRTFNCLAHRGIKSVGELCCTPIDDLLAYQSWGWTSIEVARPALAAFGLRLYDDWLGAPIAELEMSAAAARLTRELGVTTVGELLAHGSDDLSRLKLRGAVRELFAALGQRALRLKDGWPRGPQDWAEQGETEIAPDRQSKS